MNIILVDLFITYCLLVSVNAVGIALVSFTQHVRRWTRPFAIASLLTATWTITYVIELRSEDIQSKLFLYNLRQSAILLMPVYWLFIALEMYLKPQRVPFWAKIAIVIVPTIGIVLHWTSESHIIIRQAVFIDTSTPLLLIKSTRGAFYWLSSVYTVLAGMSVLLLFFVQYKRSASDERRLITALIVTFGLPSLLSMFDIIALSSRLPFTLGLIGFLPSQLILFWAYVLPLMRGTPNISYDLMFEAMEDGVIVVNAQHRIIEINNAARRLFPSVTVFINQTIDTLVSGYPLWQYAFNAQATTHFELKLGSASYDIHTSPLSTPDGKLLGYLSTVRDISRLIQTQEQLAANGERFRRLVTMMPFPVVLTSITDGRVLYVNPKAEEVFQIKNDDAQTLTVAEFYADLSQRPPLIERVRRDGYASVDDILMKRSNGQTFWATISTVRTGIDGEDVLLTAVNDITTRRDIEERLRRSESLYRSVVTASPDGILTITINGEIQMTSPSMLRLLGYDPRETHASVNIFDHIHPDDAQLSSELIEKFVSTGRLSANVTRLMHRDGHMIYTEVNGEMIYDKDKTPTGILLIVRDITERLAIEQEAFEARLQREKVTVINRLIQAASHDLRTPITVVTTAAYLQQKLGSRIVDTLVEGTQEPQSIVNDIYKIIERAKSSEAAARRLEQIVDSMVELTRLESRIEMKLKPQALNPIVQDLITSAQGRFAKKGLTLTLEMGVLPLIWIDAVEIHKVLEKLLDNAYHYTAHGGSVQVKTRVADNMAQIQVRDNGIGISTDDLKHIFDSFYRADPARSSNTGGAGLGLTIARRICELHGGRLEVESTEGVGSVFTVSLPLIPLEVPHARITQNMPAIKDE